MSRLKAALYVARHILRVWRGGQLRFRLETFGLYFPALPYRAAWWRAPWRNAVLLLRQAGAYCRWVLEMEKVRRQGPSGWWSSRGITLREPPDDA